MEELNQTTSFRHGRTTARRLAKLTEAGGTQSEVIREGIAELYKQLKHKV